MAYGHAERNLALIRQLEAETASLLDQKIDQQGELDAARPSWLNEADEDMAQTGPPTRQ